MATSITRKQIREGAAADLSLFIPVTADVVDTTNHTVTVSDLRAKLPDRFSVIDSWFMDRESDATGNAFRRVIDWQDGTKETLFLTGGPDSMANSDDAGLYFLLSPEDWNLCINEALQDLWKPFRVSITLTANDNEYSMDSITDSENHTCTWLQSRTQIFRILARSTDGANYVEERDWAGVKFIDNANGLIVHLTYMPAVYDNLTLILDCQKPYAWQDNLMDTDSDTTTCPYKLVMAAVKVQAMRKLFIRHGSDAMRPRFGAALAVTEQELTTQKNNWMPAMKPVGYQIDEPFFQDIPYEMQEWSW